MTVPLLAFVFFRYLLLHYLSGITRAYTNAQLPHFRSHLSNRIRDIPLLDLLQKQKNELDQAIHNVTNTYEVKSVFEPHFSLFNCSVLFISKSHKP